MLRAVLQNKLLKQSVKNVVRLNSVRSLTVECTRSRPNSNHPLLLTHKNTNFWKYNAVRFYALPPHKKIMLPALSPTGDTANIVSWEKKEGEKLNEGDVLAEIETDKATMSFETPEVGYLAKIIVPSGAKNVPLGSLVCIIVQNQADIAAFKDYKGDAAAPIAAAPASTPAPAASTPAPQTAAPSSSGSGGAPGGRVYASPLAKKIADEKGITLQGKGTGMFESITTRDLPAAGSGPPQAAADTGAPARVPSFTPRAGQKAADAPAGKAPSPAPGASFVDIPVTSVRAVIAKRLLQSKQTIPHYYITVEVLMDKLMADRARFNKALEKQKIKLSVNDFIIKAMAMAAKTVPDVNCMWMDTVIRQFSHVDVSVAVSTDKGLITPIVFNADGKGLIQISKDMKELAAKARANKLKPQEFQGGTICISNLGMFGVNTFCAVINPPQACILAAGASTKKLVLDGKSERGFKEVTVMNVTLSADHRVVDGAVGSNWLEVLRKNLEDPAHMIL